MLFLEENVANSGFIVRFLTCLHYVSQDTGPGQIGVWPDKIDVSGIYKSILPKALKVFQVDTLVQSKSAYSSSTTEEPGIAWETMMQLLEQCDTIGIDTSEVLGVLMRRALEVQEEAVESMYHRYFLPFISSLCLHLKSRANRNRPATSVEQSFIVQLLEIYIRLNVKMQPKKPTDWQRTLATDCNCQDCRSLLRYVEDKQNKVGIFRLPEKRRRHLESQLDDTFSMAIIRTDTPPALQVEKTNKRYKLDLEVWNAQIMSKLHGLREGSPLLDIIGMDSYTKLLQHEGLLQPKGLVAVSDPTPSRLHRPPQRGRGGPRVVSVPKKRSFLDLTKD